MGHLLRMEDGRLVKKALHTLEVRSSFEVLLPPGLNWAGAKKLATESNVKDENRLAWNEKVIETLEDGVSYIYENAGLVESEEEEDTVDALTEASVTEGLFN